MGLPDGKGYNLLIIPKQNKLVNPLDTDKPHSPRFFVFSSISALG